MSYTLLKHIHMTLAVLSASLFSVRGLALLRGAAWPRLKLWRVGSVLIDVALLGMAITLLAAYDFALLHAPWLQLKLVLLVVYIVLGAVAMRARSRAVRIGAYAAALAALAHLFGAAFLKSPLGWFSLLAGQ